MRQSKNQQNHFYLLSLLIAFELYRSVFGLHVFCEVKYY